MSKVYDMQHQQSMTEKSKKDMILNFARKRVVIYGVATLAFILFAIAMWGVWQTREAYVIVGSDVVSNEKFESVRQAKQNEFDYSIQQSIEEFPDLADTEEAELTQTELNRLAEDELILALSLEQLAKREGLQTTSEEINQALAADASQIVGTTEEASSDDARNAIKERLSWQDDDIDRHYNIRILQVKLNDKLSSQGLLVLSTDWGMEVEGLAPQQVSSVAKQTLETIAKPWLDESLERQDILNRAEGYNEQQAVQDLPPATINAFYLFNISHGDIGSMLEEYDIGDDISLNDEGDVTPLLRSEFGRYSIYRLEDVRNSDYDSWEAFLSEKRDSSVHFVSTGWDIQRALYGFRAIFSGRF